MIFYSVGFILFFIAVFLVYWGIPQKYRWGCLLLFNLYFYASFDIKAVAVLLFVTLISYFLGIYLDSDSHSNGLKIKNNNVIFRLGIVLLLLPLLIFKYLNFGFYTIHKFFSLIKIPMSEYTVKLILPIGISFFTFEAISYVCDVKWGKVRACKDFFKLFTYISFFPTITSGPIERAGKFLPQLEEEKVFNYDKAVYSLRLLLLGIFKKLVCADLAAKYIENIFGNVLGHSGLCFVLAVFMYTFQIYFDFSGYTDMARALAGLLGYELTENFNKPYFSTSIKEFWGRWHISLSNWLRDYVYIPLGGNRCSKLRKNINLLITFFVSGLWHGASFTFIVWGMIHGFWQVVENFVRDFKKKHFSKYEEKKWYVLLNRVLGLIITFSVVAFAWMFFRANSLAECLFIIKNASIKGSVLGGFQEMGMTKVSIIKCFCSGFLVIVYDFFSRKRDLLKEMGRLPLIVRWIIYVGVTVLTVVTCIHEGSNASFIYFNF